MSSLSSAREMQAGPKGLCKPGDRGLLEQIKSHICCQERAEDGLETKFERERMGGSSCLCGTVRPVLKLSELLGLMPVKVFHPVGESGFQTGSCLLVFKWKSAGAVVNTLLVVGFLVFLPFSFGETKNRMSRVFKGTDLYAFTLQIVALVFETAVLLVSGRFLRRRFIKGWAQLNQVYHEMCDAASDLQRIKVCSYLATFIIILKLVGFYVCTLWATSSSALNNQSIFVNALESLILNITWFIPYTLSMLFFSICYLIRSHFITISAMLSSILKKPNSPKLHAQIDAIRVLHEQLCGAVTEFEAFFGIQVLLTLCTGCFTVTIGAYAYIVQGEGISSSDAHEAVLWALQLYNAVIFMLLVLIGGQLVTDSASSAAPVLNSLPLSTLDDRAQKQVGAFLHKISAFPMRMSALKITNVSTTFLSSAVTNIITYLLVLMQFKLSLERASCEGQRKPTTVHGSFDFNQSGIIEMFGNNGSMQGVE